MNMLRSGFRAVALLCAVGSASAADKIKIGVSMYTQSAPYFVAQLDAAKKVAEKMGCDVVATDAGNDMIKQIADVEDMISIRRLASPWKPIASDA
jgi:ribose transport system substrate-binding protein